ncbi:MAG: hypothetical protein DRZ76_03375 [Candidatus Nealsonbacteria bacterium]|nr:MAG: hypothetical protein DRZ76_03375 [Candidatus Nealsonbacteria bacterium]
MKQLTLEEIKTFATRRNVRKIAVENFLLSLHNNETTRTAYQNLMRDAKMYRWNKETIKAIQEGIDLSIKKSKN